MKILCPVIIKIIFKLVLYPFLSQWFLILLLIDCLWYNYQPKLNLITLFADDIKLSEYDQFKQQIDLLVVVETSIDQIYEWAMSLIKLMKSMFVDKRDLFVLSSHHGSFSEYVTFLMHLLLNRISYLIFFFYLFFIKKFFSFLLLLFWNFLSLFSELLSLFSFFFKIFLFFQNNSLFKLFSLS